MISTKTIINNARFSHRPDAGISIGVYVNKEEDRVYMAAAFRNPADKFNRRLARQIIGQRIQSYIHGCDRVDYVAWEPLEGIKVGSGVVMHHLRNIFKPDIEETDSTFSIISEFGGVEERTPMDRIDAWLHIIVPAFIDAVERATQETCKS